MNRGVRKARRVGLAGTPGRGGMLAVFALVGLPLLGAVPASGAEAPPPWSTSRERGLVTGTLLAPAKQLTL
jgi:hypothetical protein